MMIELALNILDLVENSIKAKASFIEISLDESTIDDILALKIMDNGQGMDNDFARSIKSPFVTTRTTRRVGLGIPFIRQITEMCEGEFNIASEKGKGTKLEAVMKNSHIDRPPIGDIAGAIHSLIVLNPDIDFKFTYKKDNNNYSIDSREWKEVLGEVPINSLEVQKLLKKDINEGLKNLGR